MEIEESDDSGSEFKISEEEPMDEEDEEIMLDAAVRASLQEVTANGASSSSGRPSGASPAAMLRAAAAERRLARQTVVDVDDYQMDSEVEVSEVNGSSSDEEPLSAVAKRKGKSPSKVRAKTKVVTVAEMKKRQRETRRTSLKQRRADKAEERALVKKLGRRLTHVSACFGIFVNFVILI